jgi:hypothetical protein
MFDVAADPSNETIRLWPLAFEATVPPGHSQDDDEQTIYVIDGVEWQPRGL